MAGNNKEGSGYSSATSSDSFRRRQRRRLSSLHQPGGSERTPGSADDFLLHSPSGSGEPQITRAVRSGHPASSGETLASGSAAKCPTSRQAGPQTVRNTVAGASSTSREQTRMAGSNVPAVVGVGQGLPSGLNLPGGSQAISEPTKSRFKGIKAHAEPVRVERPSARPDHGAEAAYRPFSAAATLRAPAPSTPPIEPRPRMINLGIEAEFYLRAYNKGHSRSTVKDFAELLALNHNEQIDQRHPRMHCNLRAANEPDNYKTWSMVDEPSNRRFESPWGLELRSPILHVYPKSQWRNHVAETWKYLTRYYEVTADDCCSTHIHVSLTPTHTLTELKQIASAVIHFEPAFEALVPDHRRGNLWAISNWLGSPHLKQKGRSRAESIEDIEKAADEVQVFRLIQGYRNYNFSWNFFCLFEKKGTIEFRLPPASETPDEALSWAELVLNFVQACIQPGSSVRNFPSNVGGLRSFLRQVDVPGLNEPGRLQGIWASKAANAAKEPKEIDPLVTWEMKHNDNLTQGEAAKALGKFRRHT